MLTLPLHEVMIPLFFSFSHLIFFYFFTNGSCPSLYIFFSILSHLPFSLFILLICLFLTTASWNRSGWHPRSLTGQCTSHLRLPLLSFSDSHSYSCFPSCLLTFCIWLSINTTCGFIAPSVLSSIDSRLISPLHIPVSSPPPPFYQLFTHSLSFTLHPLIFISNNSSNLILI